MAKKTLSQQRWLKRQKNDIYVKKAHQEGYRSRAAYKLKEIQEKYHLIKKGDFILDLGAAPGSWSQVALELGAKVKGIDLLPVMPLEGAVFLEGDFRTFFGSCQIGDQGSDQGRDQGNDEKSALYEGILSDISPSTCGIPKVDHLKLVGMLEEILDIFLSQLKVQGFFVCKVFKGGMQNDLLAMLKKHFKKISHFKPKSSRPESPEEYLIAQGYQP